MSTDRIDILVIRQQIARRLEGRPVLGSAEVPPAQQPMEAILTLLAMLVAKEVLTVEEVAQWMAV